MEKYKKLIVIGCGSCSTKCQTGGEEQVKEMVELLKSKGKEVLAWDVFEEPCDMRLSKKDFRKMKRENPEVENVDAAILMSCGLGAQSFQEVTGIRIIPTNNTIFMGVTERIGRFKEYCKACGDCLLAYTGGICPVTRCSKGLVNGPCGGVANGHMCEYGSYQNVKCAWHMIYERLKETGELDKFLVFRGVKNYQFANNPRQVPPAWEYKVTDEKEEETA
ncbi:MAG: methylenetetrahydrofolate reductase C-terminal domain-containing protein [Candidatus Helarchaeota archaeon]